MAIEFVRPRVGDRVRVRETGETGTISAVSLDGLARVEIVASPVPGFGRGFGWFLPAELELNPAEPAALPDVV